MSKKQNFVLQAWSHVVSNKFEMLQSGEHGRISRLKALRMSCSMKTCQSIPWYSVPPIIRVDFGRLGKI